MRPLRLDLEGFGAFARHASVDFSDVELFAITGPTGSGKTTLLDAVTFALYGETPRMGRKGLKALLHPGVKKAWVQLVFRLGDEVWRVTRVIAGKTEARLERQMGAEWQLSSASEKVKTLNAAVEQLLGLDYDAFTRAILLPQGRFDAFLKGDSRERRELLFSLYGLAGLAGLRERAVARLGELRERLAEARTVSAHLEGVDAAAVEAAREEHKRLAEERDRRAAEIAALERELNALDELAELWQEKRTLEGRQKALEAEAEAMAEVEGWLERARAAEQALPEVRRLEDARGRLERQDRELRMKEEAYQKAKNAWERVNEAFDERLLEDLRTRAATLPLLEAKARTLAALGGATAGEEVADYQEATYRQLERQLRAAEERRKALSEAERLRKRAAQLEKRIADLEKELAAATERRERLKESGVELRRKLDELKQRLSAERRRADVASFRHLLRPGEPCPLCGQPVHEPPPAAQSPLAGLEAEAERLAAELEEKRGAWREAEGEIKGMRERLNDGRRQLAELREDLKRAEAAAGARGPEDVERLVARLAAMRRGLAAELERMTGGRDPETYARELRGRLAELERRAKEVERAKRALDQAQEELARARERRAALAEALGPLEESVAALLGQLGFEGPEQVEAARRSPEELERLAARLASWREERAYVAKRLEEVTRSLAGKPEVDPQALRTKKERLEAAVQARAELEAQLGRLEERIDRLERDLAQKREAEKRAAELVGQVGVWEQLAEDLKGHKFPDYLLERLQLDMLARASELLFTLSQHRYRFRLADGVYHVEDLWTGAVRPAKTLSGGETFLASLSLALSLSEHLSRGRLGALFLDEGFGTLDAEALELAAEVLEALPTQGRMVGVVTHVPELAQRLPARLVVEKAPQGSRVHWEG